MLIGAVADDFTGATDLASGFRRRGLETVVVVAPAAVDPSTHAGVDAVVVALKTRTAPVDEAVERSTAALAWLVEAGAERFALKYCSTFDSTDEGNIGPVLDAFRDRLGVDRAIVVPAFPANGRTVRDGLLYVGDDLLEDSSMRHHPLTPMTRSRLRDLLSPQTPTLVTEVSLDSVRAGVDALTDALDAAPAGYLVVDAVDDDDLVTIGRATSHHRLVSGGAGLALGVGADDAPPPALPPEFAHVTGRRLVVCGSASAATRGQISHAAATHPTRKVDLTAATADPEAEVAALAAWVRGLDADSVPVVYSVGEPSDVIAPSDVVTPGAEGPTDRRPAPASVVETVLSTLVHDLVADGTVGHVVVAGGETSGAVVTALGTTALVVGPPLGPGVCWSAATTSAGRPVALVLKSGNFGAADLFSTAWEALS
ncbi:3-oxo-tetronate kinase [Frigoribacterium sp. Leaf186]|uniref:3-oxo-tetronate kinase n=1 Tax=Frigoribacterium sp. Leaf186 TaxID=1736293 RepID=UPI000701DF3D|nr:3-oxo-tetronate kinase [Frigoribacterium sp. Leaf186]KQS16340.1 hypothetical protein ASG05_11250 [Frigoribacterium sp. Leaf186]